MTRPVIGLTTYLDRAQSGVWDVPAAFLPQVYFQAVIDAGGTAVLLPPQVTEREAVDHVLDGLDGLILTGGKDIDPGRYGQSAHPEADPPQPVRDTWEEELLTGAIEREIPFLGICRGIQLLNVARGGTLVQHLPDVIGSSRYHLGHAEFAVNDADVDEGSRLADVLGAGTLAVKSYHHQAVDRVGTGLVVTARSDDGVVQGLELPDVPFGVAVQWHPEEDAAEDARLFAALVDAARAYASARTT
jgi:putative glutamine amidotransferase